MLKNVEKISLLFFHIFLSHFTFCSPTYALLHHFTFCITLHFATSHCVTSLYAFQHITFCNFTLCHPTLRFASLYVLWSNSATLCVTLHFVINTLKFISVVVVHCLVVNFHPNGFLKWLGFYCNSRILYCMVALWWWVWKDKLLSHSCLVIF